MTSKYLTSKYQVGDSVRILNPLPNGSVGTNEFMRKQVGKITTIERVCPTSVPEGYIYKLKGMKGWSWESIMLEPAQVVETNDEEDIPEANFGSFFTGFEVL